MTGVVIFFVVKIGLVVCRSVRKIVFVIGLDVDTIDHRGVDLVVAIVILVVGAGSFVCRPFILKSLSLF